LGKAVPRKWLEEGKKISVTGAPTRWGQIGFRIESRLTRREVVAQIDFPQEFKATTQLRLRVPDNAVLKSVTLNGEHWAKFDSQTETITIPPGHMAHVAIIANYSAH
jgi:hypothetical protein